MAEVHQLIAFATEQIVPLLYSVMFSDCGVTDCLAYDVSLDCAFIGAGLCASAFEVEVPLTSKVVPDYKQE